MAAIFKLEDGSTITRSVDLFKPENYLNSVVSVKLDGKELEYVANRFINLPGTNCHEETLTYYGDHAKFIAGNW